MTSTSDTDPNLRLVDPVDGRSIITPKITVDLLQAMLECGAVEERPSWELLDGVVVRIDKSRAGDDPMTIHPQHVSTVERLSRLKPEFEARDCHMRMQAPIALRPFNTPEPDGCIVRGDIERYAKQHPTPQDILCVIEVSDASLETDRRRKLRLYAEYNLPLYVILNLRDKAAIVHTQPQPDEASYGQVETLGAGDILHLPTAAGHAVEVSIDDLLPTTHLLLHVEDDA